MKNSLIDPFILTESSPRDYAWDSITPIEGVPEFNRIGYSDTKEASKSGEHQHPGSFEFQYVEKGRASWEVNNFHYEVKAGEIFFTRPGEFHCPSNNVREPNRVWYIGLRAPIISDEGAGENWLQQHDDDKRPLLEAINNMPRVTYLGAIPLLNFRNLVKVILQPGSFSRLKARTVILDFILTLLDASKSANDKKHALIHKIEQLTLAHPIDCKLNIDALAANAGISRAYFYRLFLEYTGMTPRAYFERLRIKEACQRLTESDAPVTSIAMELGFATSQHFATVFYRLTGRTPTEWRNKIVNLDSWLDAIRNSQHDFMKVREK